MTNSEIFQHFLDDGQDLFAFYKDEPESFPGYAKALEDYLENSNQHDLVGLPYLLQLISEQTPLQGAQKDTLLKRLCNAVYNAECFSTYRS